MEKLFGDCVVTMSGMGRRQASGARASCQRPPYTPQDVVQYALEMTGWVMPGAMFPYSDSNSGYNTGSNTATDYRHAAAQGDPAATANGGAPGASGVAGGC